MQLLYLWIDSFKNIEKIGVSFSTENDIILNHNKDEDLSIQSIHIREKKNEAQLFEPIVTSITGIIGKNGSGKTNILDLIGMNLETRENESNSSYFLLYKKSDTKYVIEGRGIKLIQPFLRGLNISKTISGPYSMLLNYDRKAGVFKFINFLEDNDIRNNFTVLSAKQQESNSRMFGLNNLKEDTHLCQRILLHPSSIGYYSKYKMLVAFNRNNKEGQLFHAKNRVYLKISSNIKYSADKEYELVLKVNYKREYRSVKKLVAPDLVEKPHDKEEQRWRWIMFLNEDYIHFTWTSLIRHMRENDEEKEIPHLKKQIESIKIPSENKQEYYEKILRSLMGEVWDRLNKDSPGKNMFFHAYKELIKLILAIPAEAFNEGSILIPIDDNEQKVIIELLEKLDSEHLNRDSPDLLNKILRVEFFPFSSGEEAFLNLFATLYFGITLNKDPQGKTLLILLDEPDQFMHPEWCRLFIWELQNFLKSMSPGYMKYQIIFTTHSPFLVSDLPSSHVISLEKNQVTGECMISSDKLKTQTFANNIHTLLANKFFLDSTMGELATRTINKIITRLNKPRPLGPKEKKKLYALIELIGEPIIRNRLFEMYNIKVPQDKEERLRELLKQQKKINMEIEQIKGENI
ncbi:AAA family ATPase [Priestia megaterium]|uniref:AAA family ATPase n=1 Tax=Priestia megaterium TaxID=1404 RepID=UPI003BA1F2D0